MKNRRGNFACLTLVAFPPLVVAIACSAARSEDLGQELKKVACRIVFESYQDQNWDLFMVRADGSERVNLTRTRDVNELYPLSSLPKRLPEVDVKQVE